ncbi:MAG: hypothetical protein HY698_07805 [Deltaproteobacteria bacterium]|nr:hypothetical protein [Deltaproteobacteria bacterium]
MVTRKRHRLVFVRLALAALGFHAGMTRALGAEHDLPGGLGLATSGTLSLTYDDNALLGRRGQFLDSPAQGENRRKELATRQAIDIEVARSLGVDTRASLTGRFDFAKIRSSDELAGWDASSGASIDIGLPSRTRLFPQVNVVYHREQPEWTFRTIEPAVRAVRTLESGLLMDVVYRYSIQDFARRGNGIPERKNSYGNVDFRGHRATLDLRQWLGRRLRLNVRGEAWTATYGGHISATLADYAGLSEGQERADRGGGVLGEVLHAPRSWLLLSAGVRYDRNDSNGNAFTFWDVRAIGSALLSLRERHSLFAQLDYGRYDFPNEHFDRRYANTRVDFRREVVALYRFAATERFKLEAVFRRIDAISSDCSSFNPLRDASGLPVYSRSYSCYGRTRMETSARWEF